MTMKIDKKERQISTTNIFMEDLLRLQALKKPEPNRVKYGKYLESAQTVIHRAIEALEEKERNSK